TVPEDDGGTVAGDFVVDRFAVGLDPPRRPAHAGTVGGPPGGVRGRSVYITCIIGVRGIVTPHSRCNCARPGGATAPRTVVRGGRWLLRRRSCRRVGVGRCRGRRPRTTGRRGRSRRYGRGPRVTSSRRPRACRDNGARSSGLRPRSARTP